MGNTVSRFLKKWWLYATFLVLSIIWLSIFELKVPAEWDILSVIIRGVYFTISFTLYITVRKLKTTYIKNGIGLLTIGLFFYLLDDFTLEKSNLTFAYIMKGAPAGIGFFLIIIDSYRLVKKEELVENNLKTERSLFETIMDNHPDYIYFKNREGKFVRVNKARAKISGTTPEKMVGKTDFDFFPEREAKQIFDDDLNIIKTGKPLINKIEKLTFYNDKKHWVSTSKIPWYSNRGKIIGIMGVSLDITSYIEMQNELRESEEKFRTFAESSPVGIYLVQDGIIKYANPKTSEIFGYKVNELVGKDVLKTVVHPEDRGLVGENIKKRINRETNFINYSFRAVKKGGKVFDAEIFGSRIIYQNKPAIIGMVMDITERKNMEKRLRDLTIKDHLTGLFNRRYFSDRIKGQINVFKRYKEVFSLLYVDIDGFKNCNDNYGHQMGDKILQNISQIFCNNLRNTDSAYRVGGEEFAIIITHTPKEEAKKVAERIRKEVYQKLYPLYKITVSIGIADSKMGDQLVKIADKAMYEAKRKGKNKVWVA